MYTYDTKGTCSKQIILEMDKDIVKSCEFVKGCRGNLIGISQLVVGMHARDVIKQLKGIKCQANTSCPDQLALALEKYCKDQNIS